MNNPKVTIGVPVHNEEKHLAKALDSILSQQTTTFHAHILENCSTDKSLEIANQFKARYPDKFTIHQSPSLLDPETNFNRIFSIDSPSKYLCWLGAHDQWEPNFLQACTDQLDADSSIALCYPRSLFIDENDTVIPYKDSSYVSIPGFYDTRGLDPQSRIYMIIHGMPYCYQYYGVYRKKVLLSSTNSRPNTLRIVGPDLVHLCELAKYGHIVGVDKPSSKILMRTMPTYGSWKSYLSKLDIDESNAMQTLWNTIDSFNACMKIKDGNILIECANMLERFSWAIHSFIPKISPNALNSQNPDKDIIEVLTIATNLHNELNRILSRNRPKE